jgi:hypothetical protein
MGLLMDKLTSINIVVVWPHPNRASVFADAQFGVINKQQMLPSHHQQPPSPSPPHTNTDGPPPPPPCIATSLTAKCVPTMSTTAHTNLAQHHVVVTTWHINGTLQTCHEDGWDVREMQQCQFVHTGHQVNEHWPDQHDTTTTMWHVTELR